MNNFHPMVYVGAWEDLEGKTALVKPSTQPGKVLAQFDDVGQRTVHQISGARNVTELEQLMFGWHEFAEDDFRAIQDNEYPDFAQGRTERAFASISLAQTQEET